jgi:long-chain acyl-CoA synthetase
VKVINNFKNRTEDINVEDTTKYDYLLECNKKYMNYTALTFGNKRVSYEELHTRIDEYARALYKRGVRQGDYIAVCVANTPESVYLLYALDKLGAVVVGISPLNNEYKMKRDLELVKPKMLISVDMMYKKFKQAEEVLDYSTILYSPVESLGSPIIKVGYVIKQLLSGNYILGKDYNLKSIIRSGKRSDVEYAKYEHDALTDIMFTGGSSGVHKGVDLAGNRLNYISESLKHVLPLEPGMIHLGNIPLAHMAFGKVLLHYALSNNLEYALTLNMLPDKFYDELVRTQANGAMGGPIHWKTLIGNPKLKQGSLSNLIQSISGGELFKEEDRIAANKALKYCGSSSIIGDGFGQTETWAPTHVNIGGINSIDSIGYEIPFVKTRIVNPDTFEDVEIGTPGLLLSDSPGVMLGYHNNDEETQKVFYQDEKGTIWYNTGDIVMRKPENPNEFKFVGRRKRNFVSGVDNIYPEQVESLLMQLPDIEEVVVTGIRDDVYQYLPKYHIKLRNNDCDINSLEKSINELIMNTLGESALPGYIEYTTEALPRTDNGKLNATLLQEMDNKRQAENKLELKLKR